MSAIILSQEIIQELCDLFRSGCAIPELMTRYSLSRNKVTKTLRDALGDEYAECAKKIIALSGKKAAVKLRGRKNPHTPEWNAKISESNRGRKISETTRKKISESSRTRFERGTWTKEKCLLASEKAIATKRANGYFIIHSERHSKWMSENSPMKGKRASEETRQKMREAKQRFFAKGGKPSQLGRKKTLAERQACSRNAKRMWAEGKFTYDGGPIKRSKLEKRIFEQVQAAHPDAQHSFLLRHEGTTYVFDIYVPSLNLLIEVNGNYWHFNPRMYEASHYDKHRHVTAEEIWQRDAEKRQRAKDLGFDVIVVWEDQVDFTNHTPSVLDHFATLE